MRREFLVLLALSLLASHAFAQAAPSFCPVSPIRSYMDITLDPANKEAKVFVYNITGNYGKTGLPGALIIKADLSDLSDIKLCYDATDGAGWAAFPYDPNVEGCLDYWFIFCPLNDAPTDLTQRQMCLNGSSLQEDDILPNIDPCDTGSSGATPYSEYLPSHNELYFCNQVPKDFGPLCWPLMLIFGLLVGASFALGRNPFQAFDFSSPRMGRGRQYTTRVQQKSFDLLGYAFAAQSAADTAGKAGGFLANVVSGEREVYDASENKIGNLDKDGKTVKNDKGAVIGTYDKEKNIVTNKKGEVLGANGLVIGVLGRGGNILYDNSGENIIGRRDENGKMVMIGEGGKTFEMAGTRFADLGWGKFGPVAFVTEMVGMVVTSGFKAAFGDEARGEKKGDAPLGKPKVTTELKTAAGKQIEGIYIPEKTSGSYIQEKTTIGGKVAPKQRSSVDIMKYGVTQSTAPFAALYTSPNILGIFSIFIDQPWSLSNLSKEDREFIAGWEMDTKTGKGKDGFGFTPLENMLRVILFAAHKYKDKVRLTLLTEGGGFWDQVKGMAKALYQLYTVVNAISTFSKAFGKGIRFVEDFHSLEFMKVKVPFTSQKFDISIGSFVSYLDPSSMTGAGLPYGLNIAEPLFANIRDRISLMLASEPDAIYRGGLVYSTKDATGQAQSQFIIVSTDKGYGVLDREGNLLTTKKQVLEKIDDETVRRRMSAILDHGLDSKTLEMLRDGNLGFGEGYVKTDMEGKSSFISEKEYCDSLDRQVDYYRARMNLLFTIEQYENPNGMGWLTYDEETRIAMDEKRVIEEGMPIGQVKSMLEGYETLGNDGREALREQLIALQNQGIINVDSETLNKKEAFIREDITGMLGQVGEMVDLRERNFDIQKHRMVAIEIQNLQRMADTLNYVADNPGSEVAWKEYGKYFTYQQAELEARQTYNMLFAGGEGGITDRISKYVTGTSEEREDIKLEFKEEQEKLQMRMGEIDDGSAEYKLCAVKLTELKVVNGMIEGTPESELPSKLQDVLKNASAMETAGNIIRHHATGEAELLNEGSALIYNASKLDLSQSSTLEVIRQMNQKIGDNGIGTEEGIGKVAGRLEKLNQDIDAEKNKPDPDVKTLEKLNEEYQKILNPFGQHQEILSRTNQQMTNILSAAEHQDEPIPEFEENAGGKMYNSETMKKSIEAWLNATGDLLKEQNSYDNLQTTPMRWGDAKFLAADLKLQQEELSYAKSLSDVITNVTLSRDYGGSAWERQQSVQMLQTSLDKVNDMVAEEKDIAKKKSLIDNYSSWVSQFAVQEQYAYSTSNEYLEAQVSANLNAVRFSPYYMTNPETEFLEGNVGGRGLKWPWEEMRMPWQSYREFLYGEQKSYGLPTAWKEKDK